MNIMQVYTLYISPILDVLFLTVLFYLIYKVLVRTQAAQLLRGIFVLLFIYAIAFILRLNTVLWLLNAIAPSLLIGIVILFQPELRKIFMKMGQREWLRPGSSSRHSQIDAIVNAATIMSAKRRGMLVVFARKSDMSEIMASGTRINADITSSLFQTIFEFDTTLHDGAVVVQNGRLLSAGCVLKLSEQQDISKSFGTRHRAALGTAETSDAVVLVVSEESGALSLAYDSKLYYDLDPQLIINRLEVLLGIKASSRDLEYIEGENE
ncbi:MAG: diadenylate cyclase CdaA [Spirochaetaceae bacterium]|nr:diadenylate cyclase CdaA [Spirochaetaceae bacterium]